MNIPEDFDKTTGRQTSVNRNFHDNVYISRKTDEAAAWDDIYSVRRRRRVRFKTNVKLWCPAGTSKTIANHKINKLQMSADYILTTFVLNMLGPCNCECLACNMNFAKFTTPADADWKFHRFYCEVQLTCTGRVLLSTSDAWHSYFEDVTTEIYVPVYPADWAL